jgi:ketosteroid isomerase-like protein
MNCNYHSVMLSKTFAGFVSVTARWLVIALLALPASHLTLGQPAARQTDRANLQGKVERELVKLEQEWADAVVRGEIAVLDRIEADDLIITDPDGKVSNKAQGLADIKSGAYKVESIKLDDMKVQAYRGTAVVTGRTTMTGQYKGKDLSGQYRWTDVFVKRQGRWQVVATHASQIAP